MARFTLGGKTFVIGELNFLAVERAWPYITDAMVSQDPIKGVSAGLHVLAAGLMEEEGFKPDDYGLPEDKGPYIDHEIFLAVAGTLKKRCKSSEIGEVKDAVFQIIEESGLTEEGELKAAPSPSLGTETSDQSSQSLSPPDAKVEAGAA
jgi:hypothetical protein